jgi:6,7-dimethyl-8-ribityllumazine synthase
MTDVREGIDVIEGRLDATGLRVGIVVARFNALVTERLLDGALDCLRRHGAAAGDLVVVRVPGSFEIAAAALRLAERGDLDAVIGLGCLMRGDTIHFDLIAAEVTKGLAHAALHTKAAVSFGVLTTDTLEQSMHRAGAKYGNKGAEAALAAIEQAQVLRAIAGAAAGSSGRDGGRPAGRRKR